MTKKDPATTISAADRLLEVTTDPLHRQILENYRRHAILEVTGEWEGIFDEDSAVEHPVYRFNITGYEGVVADGADAVKGIYQMLRKTSTCVILVEDEKLNVCDWGFASESFFNTYQRGTDLIKLGLAAEKPDGYYILRQRFAMIWPYDERGRMAGEHVYEDKSFREIIEIAVEDYVTPDDARARLLPLLRPLPKFSPPPKASKVSKVSVHA